jgi:hypothetical protein
MAILRPSIFSAGWTLLAAEQVENLPPHLQVGDFDGDGKADLAGRYQQGGQWWSAVSSGSDFATSLWTTWPA